jgi:aryl-alcohol dehydrogenase-like predicted oxidoreductase
MDNTSFGKTGYSLSKIGLGTVQFGVDYGYTKKKTQQEVDEILLLASKCNINYLDTANEYGDSEKKIGKFLTENDANFIIFTKLKKLDEEQCHNKGTIKEAMMSSVQESLINLGQDSIDFLLLHQADPYIISNTEVFDNLLSFKKEGIIKGFGVSVYEPNEVKFILNQYGDIVDFFQIPLNIFDRRFEAVLDMLYARKIGVICRSIYLKGIIPCANEQVPEGLKGILPYKDKLQKMSKASRLTSKEMALLSVTSDKRVSSTILGIDTLDELRENVSIIENKSVLFQLGAKITELEITDEDLIDPRKWSNF